MNKSNFSWKRLWCKAEGRYQLDTYGFAESATSSAIQWRPHPDVYELKQLQSVPCLILLGEPGIGKSVALREAIEECQRNRISYVSISATSCCSLDHLHRKLFESTEWKKWLEGTSTLHVFVDSLDEGRLFFEGLIDEVLLDGLCECRQHRDICQLRFRLVCRRADWFANDTTRLKDLWGEDAVKAYELIPLTRSDVEYAASMFGYDGPRFVNEVIAREIVPLATRPVTLNMMLAQYEKQGELPRSRHEAYENGCRLLAQESSEPRMKKGKKGQFCEAQRLEVASCIAATMLLARKGYVSVGPHEDKNTFDSLELVGKQVDFNGSHFSVTEDAIRETLGCALFSGGQSENSLTWTHHTFAEYLAARFLLANTSSTERLLHLLSVSVLGDTKLVPEFHELVAWIAALDKAVLDIVLQSEPQVLLRSDPSSFGDSERAVLVERLLLAAEHEDMRDLFSLSRYFAKLRHQHIITQLRPYVSESNRHTASRMLALEIAEMCEASELAEDVLQLALCSGEDRRLRYCAVAWISSMVQDDRLARLVPLVRSTEAEDPDDEVRGRALRLLWPRHLSAVEMFSSLGLPRRRSFIGSYWMFLKHELAGGLDAQSAPVALRWTRIFIALPGSHHLTLQQDVVSAIAARALEYAAAPEVLEELAALLCTSGSRYRHPFDGGYGESESHSAFDAWLLDDDERRRSLIGYAHAFIMGEAPERYCFVDWFVRKPDFQFVLERLRSAEESRSRDFWAHCLKSAFDSSSSVQEEALIPMFQKYYEVQRLFRVYFAADAELGSETARGMQASFRGQDVVSEHPIRVCPNDSLIDENLDALRRGDVAGWSWLRSEFVLGSEQEQCIVARSAWSGLGAFMRARFADACISFLTIQDPRTVEWRETNFTPYVALAGIECFSIIHAVDEGLLQQLDVACWQRWSPALIPIARFSGYGELVHPLLPVAYRCAMAEYLESLEFGLSGRSDSDAMWYVESIAGPVWDDRISERLIRIARSRETYPDSLREVLTGLLRRQPEEGIALAESVVVSFSTDHSREQQALEASILLLREGVSTSWTLVWPFVSDTCERLRIVLGRLGTPFSWSKKNKLAQLQVAHRALLYRAALQLFPPQALSGDIEDLRPIQHDDPETIKGFFLDLLKLEPCEETCAEFQSIVRDFPEYSWLRTHLNESIDVVRGTNWKPIAPSHLFEYLRDQRRRFVRSADELVDAVADSLSRLENYLRSSVVGSQQLWNFDKKKKKKIGRPEEETYLSGVICDWLKRDLGPIGVVSSCEVAIRHVEKKTDLLLTATVHQEGNQILSQFEVVVEVKGSWHDRALDIESELIERYLTPTNRTHGLFVLVYFGQNRWDIGDRRRAKSSRNSPDGLEVLRGKIETTARLLCRDGLVVRGVVIDGSL